MNVLEISCQPGLCGKSVSACSMTAIHKFSCFLWSCKGELVTLLVPGHWFVVVSGILDENAADTLVNYNMLDDEKAYLNLERKKKKPDYNPYDEAHFDEYGVVSIKYIF